MIALHLFLVVRNGISDPPRRAAPVDPAQYRKEYQVLLKREGEPFFSKCCLAVDIIFGSAVVLVIVALATIFGAPELGPPPDPTIINAQPRRPDWYLLWYFAALALLPHGSEDFVIVWGPLLLGALIFFFPLFANRGQRHPAQRPWAVIIVIGVVTIIGSFTVAGYQANWSPDFYSKPLSTTVISSNNPHVRIGADLFFKKACINCHQISGDGGKRGPELSSIARRLTEEEMVIRIVNGGYNMPAYGPSLKSEELSNIISFLKQGSRSHSDG